MITEMNRKRQENIYHANVNVNFMDVSVKKFMHVKNIMLGILLHVNVKMENIQQVLWMIQQLSVTKL